MPKIITKEIFIEKAKAIHGDLYDYGKVDYVNTQTKIKIVCRKEGHGIFEQSPNHHLAGSGCHKCAGKNKTTPEFIQEAKFIHGDLYDYSLVNYIGATTKIKIVCRKEGHGVFEQQPNNHLSGYGCPKCGGSEQSNTDDFIKKAITIHGDLYDYDSVDYNGALIKVKIICKKEGHGVFEQLPNNHLSGYGCPKCGGSKPLTKETFIERTNAIHGHLYIYDKVDYINSYTKVKIICRKEKHDEFEQTPYAHLRGAGCPKCSSTISLPEIIWLNINHIKPEFRQYKILNYAVDGYDPETNTIYEFHGDYWHGNPAKFEQTDTNKVAHKTFGELYNQTINREQEIKTAGYNLVVIWESEFRDQYKEQIKNYKSIHGVKKIIECNSYN